MENPSYVAVSERMTPVIAPISPKEIETLKWSKHIISNSDADYTQMSFDYINLANKLVHRGYAPYQKLLKIIQSIKPASKNDYTPDAFGCTATEPQFRFDTPNEKEEFYKKVAEQVQSTFSDEELFRLQTFINQDDYKLLTLLTIPPLKINVLTKDFTIEQISEDMLISTNEEVCDACDGEGCDECDDSDYQYPQTDDVKFNPMEQIIESFNILKMNVIPLFLLELADQGIFVECDEVNEYPNNSIVLSFPDYIKLMSMYSYQNAIQFKQHGFDYGVELEFSELDKLIQDEKLALLSKYNKISNPSIPPYSMEVDYHDDDYKCEPYLDPSECYGNK
jgi:hypothetical protein